MMTKRKPSYKRSSTSKSRKDADTRDIPKIMEVNTMEKTFIINQKYELTPIHKSFVELCYKYETKLMFVDGPAGTAKTYCAALAGLSMLKSHNVDEIIYIRSIIESASKSMGALPGEVDDKFQPWTLPLQEKLSELVSTSTSRMLFEKGIVKAVPVNYVRGLTFKDSVVIVDEAQNLTRSELITILTRFGEDSKMIVIGDCMQSDIQGKSGFADIFHTFDDRESEDNGVFCFKFTDQDIMRSEMLKFIVRKLGE
jgi:phosphate starvation-inducible protein PhoH and related proteins